MNTISIGKALVAITAGALLTANSLAIMSPEERSETIERAFSLLESQSRPVSTEALADVADPFSPERAKAGAKEEAQDAFADPAATLSLLSDYIKPTGIFAIRDERYLMIGERKYRAGSTIPIIHNKREYKLTLTQVSRAGFTLEFGGEVKKIKLN